MFPVCLPAVGQEPEEQGGRLAVVLRGFALTAKSSVTSLPHSIWKRFVTHSFSKYLRARCVRGCRRWAKGRAPSTVRFPSVGSRDQIPFPCTPRPPQAQLACTWPCVLTKQGHPAHRSLSGLLPCCRLQSRPSARVESSFVP